MKLVRLIGLTAVLLAGALFVASAEEDSIDERDLTKTENKYVRISTNPTTVYQRLDPRSEIVGYARPGDFLELLSEGQLWYKVRIDVTDDDGAMVTRTGYVQARDGNPVQKKSNPYILVGIVVGILILGSAGGITYLIKKSSATA
ncbi:MAG: hypothetical protein LBU70_00345 [Chitinispirillales bacterium]|jgi:flagellar basal body-associated protein FliL|nr:hypothetical protein [Chitinispirillales bacterium]